MTTDLDALSGVWVMNSGEQSGQPLPDTIVKAMRREVKGNDVSVTMNGQIYFQATFMLNPDATPRTIDYTLTHGPRKGQSQLGIYEIENGALKLCFAELGKARPATFSSAKGNLLTVWKRDEGSAPSTGAQAGAGEFKMPPPPPSSGQKLGEAAEISLRVATLGVSVTFYQKLGFKTLAETSGAQPSATLTDGMIIVRLIQGSAPSPVLTYYAADMVRRVAKLEKLGIAFESKTGSEACFSDGNGLRVRLVTADALALPQAAGKSFSNCGMFGELCTRTKDAKAAAAFWDKCGFGTAGGGDQPYSYRILMDGKLILGVHENNTDILMPTLTYFDGNSKARIATLKKNGIQFESEASGVLKSPDGQMIFLYNW